jgi:hypothetical protein
VTIKIPADNILDRILKYFGKKRGVILPPEANKIYKKTGPYVQIKARKENFFKALFSKK